MGRKSFGNNNDTLIDNISLGFTSVLGIAGAVAGVFIPGAAMPTVALQAGAYCPAIVAVVMKQSVNGKRFSKKLEEQIKICAETTAKDYLAVLKNNDPTMYSLLRFIWDDGEIYDQNPTLDSIEKNMKSFLDKENRWGVAGKTPKDIDAVVKEYVKNFFINARNYPELNQYILYGVVQKMDELEEPIIDNNGTKKSVCEFLETWVESKNMITVIGGEPGHGKTSLCWKAMCDHYNNGWLAGKVNNVFCFSLNPANTDALSNNSINLYRLLSWGNNRTNKEHLLNESDCENALIFFDAFDELIEWIPGLSLIRFIEDKIVPFQEETGSHIVITTRNMAIEHYTDKCFVLNEENVLLNRLQSSTRSQQVSWIESYIEIYRSTSPEKAAELEEYLKSFIVLPKDDEFDKLLGIPIIFRMLVAALYLPKKNSSIPRIYDELFHITWIRHSRKTEANDELSTKRKLQNLALNIYIDNNDTAELVGDNISPWLFSFYTTYEGKKRVGFLHRSFYQYFLAHEILSWYREYVEVRNDDHFKDYLSYLARRALDETTLEYLRDLFYCNNDKEYFKDAFDKSYEILKETDGFIPSPQDESEVNKIKNVKQIVKANNAFGNIISIGCLCGQKVTKTNVNAEAIRAYDLTGCTLVNAMLSGTLLRFAYLPKSNLIKADLTRTDLSGADLSEADLRWSDLSNAKLRKADLSRANLSHGNLCHVNLSEADLSGANLSSANLSSANLSEADLSSADLSSADLSCADLSCANLGGKNYIGDVCLVNSGANLSHANLCHADIRGADLIRANLNHADLREADLSEADLSWADLREANLSGANLSGANLYHAKLCHADLRGADLSFTDLSLADLSGADLSGANLKDAAL